MTLTMTIGGDSTQVTYTVAKTPGGITISLLAVPTTPAQGLEIAKLSLSTAEAMALGASAMRCL